MKIKIVIIIALFINAACYAIDTKLTGLTVLGSADCGDDELIYVVDDPNGTPVSRKIARYEFLLGFAGSTNITTLGTIASGTWQGTAIADAYVPDNITIDLATLATTVTVEDETTDTTCFPAFVTAATGSLGGKTAAVYTFNSATGSLGATEFVGGGAGLTAVDAATGDSATDFFDAGEIADDRISDTLTSSTCTGTAGIATLVTITDNEDTAENNPIVFVAGADPDGGNLGLETDGHAHYNPSTGTITATEFVGGGAGLTALAGTNITANTIDEPTLETTNAADAGTDNYLLSYNHAGTNFTWVASGAGMSSFIAEDGDGTEVSISDQEEWKFVEGSGIDIDWTDVSNGSDEDPFDLTFTVTLGTDIAAAEMANEDHGDVQWSGGDADVESMDLGDATTGTYYVGLFADDTGTSRPIYADAPLSYAQATGTLTATEFSGGGASLTGIDAATGDSATDFFDAGALADDRVPDNITIDLATLATTVTLGDDDATNDDHDIVFTTDAAGPVNLEADIGDLKYNPSTGLFTTPALATTTATITNNIKNMPRHMIFNIINPLATQTEDTQVCLWPLTPAAITITNIKITLDAAGNEVVGDLKFADTFIGLGTPTVINICDTSSGVLDDSAMGDGTVPATKCIYFEFDSAPNTAITQMCVDITFDYD